MKKSTLKNILTTTGLCTLLAWSSLQANEFNLYYGLGYGTGGKDVTDWYESNAFVTAKGAPGLGASLRIAYKLDNNIRIDFGTGNMTFMTGDLTFYSVPLNLTGGYDFKLSDDFSLYARGGIVYNISDGDYVTDNAGTGFVAAAGLEYGSFFMEVSGDTSKSTFSRFGREEDVAINGITLTLGGFF